MNWRVHLISFGIFLFAVGAFKLVWDNPKIILYLVLSLKGMLAYGAVYIIVKSKTDDNKKS